MTMLKVVALTGQFFGFVSSILLVWGYTPPRGMAIWRADTEQYDKSEKRLRWVARVGFALLAVSFLIGFVVTLVSN